MRLAAVRRASSPHFSWLTSLLALLILALPSIANAAAPPHFWSLSFGDPDLDLGRSLVPDGLGNTYAAASFSLQVDFGAGDLFSAGLTDIALVKFDANGAAVWSKSFGGSGSDLPNAIVLDGERNLLVIGYFSDTVDFGGGNVTAMDDATDIFLAKYDSTGTHMWSKRFGESSSDFGNSVAVDGSNNVIITGSFGGTVDFGGGSLVGTGSNNAFLAKYDASGTHLWSQAFSSAGSVLGSSVAVDASGNAFVTGRFSGTVDFGGGPLTSAGTGGSSDDIFVAKFDANGAHLWSQRYGDSLSPDTGVSVAVDGSGNVVVAGYFLGTVDFGGGNLTSAGDEDVFVAKYDALGSHVWSRRFGNTGTDNAQSATLDGSGNVLVTGHYTGSVDFGGGPIANAGIADIFVASYDASGGHLWSTGFGCSLFDAGTRVIADGPNVLVTGYFADVVDFGGGPLNSRGYFDMFLVKLGQSPVAVPHPVLDAPSAFQLYPAQPNPFSVSTTLRFGLPMASPVRLQIIDVQGRIVSELVNGVRTAGRHQIEWDGRGRDGSRVGAGMYFYRLESSGFRSVKPMVRLR